MRCCRPSPAIVASAAWIWIHAGFMASLLAGIFLLMALLQRYFAAGGGIAGFAGFAMALVSLVFVFGLDYAEAFIFPTLAVEFPAVVHAYGDGTSMPSVAWIAPGSSRATPSAAAATATCRALLTRPNEIGASFARL